VDSQTSEEIAIQKGTSTEAGTPIALSGSVLERRTLKLFEGSAMRKV